MKESYLTIIFLIGLTASITLAIPGYIISYQSNNANDALGNLGVDLHKQYVYTHDNQVDYIISKIINITSIGDAMWIFGLFGIVIFPIALVIIYMDKRKKIS